MHPLDEDSPLHGWSEEDFARSDATLVIIFSGHDENSNQLVRGRRLYSMQDVLLDHDYADLQRTDPDGMTILDFGQFNRTRPVGTRPEPL